MFENSRNLAYSGSTIIIAPENKEYTLPLQSFYLAFFLLFLACFGDMLSSEIVISTEITLGRQSIKIFRRKILLFYLENLIFVHPVISDRLTQLAYHLSLNAKYEARI